ncbi:F-box domain-containing protein [Delitschia confertaspora ATCC 74209]|uniref:F-box domain-containing protein n=1 Tax=Delitschia confertaspora ATCC 74209 TaxID=1513339 RepID=A0A9P4MLM9_9PLEO|nr:F-box domain-containing protein [Delitschia confertaspora ATCC 74209]
MSSTSSAPPLLRLPVELHRDIVDLLPFQDKVRLRLTNQHFCSVIKPPTHQEYLAVESRPWATSQSLFACSACKRLRPLLKFSDDMRKGSKSRHGSEAHLRFCIDCGVERGKYKAGTELKIMGKACVVCRICHRFADAVGSKGACNSCLPLPNSTRAIGSNIGSGYADGPYELNDDWTYAVTSYEDNHSDDWNGLWHNV